MKTLLITNDFPPRPGGIQQYVHGLASRLPPDEIVVLASSWRGADAFDEAQPFAVVRESGTVLLPTRRVLRRAREIARAEQCDAVWFGAAAPLGLLGARLRKATGIERVVASTHGHEVGWARLPGARAALRRIGRTSDVVTCISDYTRERLARVVSKSTLTLLPPGVDTDVFHPGAGGDVVRRRLGLEGRPVVVCVSRLVPRKGQDVLLRALPAVRDAVPDATLLLVGGGPDMPRLQRLAVESGVADAVRFTGSVPWAQLPAHYASGDVFAMPCRTRRGGLDVEGLGIVYLEAAAAGLPVVAGRSGGAPEGVLDGETGLVVDGRDVAALAASLSGLLTDADRARRMGAAGRRWAESVWRWDVLAARLRGLLAGRGQPDGATSTT
ncbi:MAG: glycosyltransferase family 4 protein [Mycobacteriales bacterium]|nr:glycosyltransferase family 4 protein [Frankia sp.]